MTAPRSPLLAVVAFLVLCGCASPWKRDTIYNIDADGVFLYREHEERDAQRIQKGFSHPAAVTEEEMGFLLRRLVCDRKPLFRSPKPGAVFTSEEVDRLARPLALSLGVVKGDERVRFLVTRSSIGDLFTGLSGVSGVVFQTGEGGILHIAFDAIDEAIHEGDGGRAEDVSFPYDPTAETYKYGLHPFEGARLHRDPESGELYRRWLEVDRKALKQAVARREPTEDDGAGKSRAPPGETEKAPAGKAATPPAGAPEATGKPAADNSPERPGPVDEQLRERLEHLRRLRDNGLLPEDVYKERVNELLKEKGL